MSLSARRAWIEIRQQPAGEKQRTVALRKESVDRNHAADMSERREARSLSARRAWIEIRQQPAGEKQRTVALRKESVDRNLLYAQQWHLAKHVALRKESVDRNDKVHIITEIT